jgi:hypothetical protein
VRSLELGFSYKPLDFVSNRDNASHLLEEPSVKVPSVAVVEPSEKNIITSSDCDVLSWPRADPISSMLNKDHYQALGHRSFNVSSRTPKRSATPASPLAKAVTVTGLNRKATGGEKRELVGVLATPRRLVGSLKVLLAGLLAVATVISVLLALIALHLKP